MNKTIFIFLVFVFSINTVAQTKDSIMFREFGEELSCDEIKLIIDNFYEESLKYPNAQRYIVYYGGKTYKVNGKENLPRRNESKTRAEEFLDFYQVFTRIAPLKLIDGGYRKKLTIQFWIVPKGAKLPEPNPAFKPEEIKFRKGRYKKDKYRYYEGC